MGLANAGSLGGSGKKISQYVLVETASTSDNNASIKLSYYENDVLKESVTKIFTTVSGSPYTFHFVFLSYGSEKWTLGRADSSMTYNMADSKSSFDKMFSANFTSSSWPYNSIAKKIIYPASIDIAKTTVSYLKNIFGV